MPQFDQYKNRTVNIEFIAAEDIQNLPHTERLSLVFITNGRISGRLNDRPVTIEAPGILCLSEKDSLQIIEEHSISAQSFCFHPDFLSSLPLAEAQNCGSGNLRIKTGLSLFQRDGAYTGVPSITEKAYPQLFEWFFVLGTEVSAHSDALWVCRIKKYLIQILGLLENLSRRSEQSPVDAVLEYIHTNYSDKITLDDLIRCAHLNRVSLNKMLQERWGCTAMSYLLSYRLKVAGELLTHTDMRLNEIARSTGFEYDTYFIKQFTAKKGISPTAYRTDTRKIAALV